MIKKNYSKTDFQIIKKIGRGSYGTVFKARQVSSGKIVAIKTIPVNGQKKDEIQQALNEIRILGSNLSPYLVEYIDSFIDNQSMDFWIVMEFMPDGDLKNLLDNHKEKNTKFSESFLWRIFIQILIGIRDLHQNSIIHRDIKPANIFINKEKVSVKIGDLNISKILKNNQSLAETQIGTPFYLAPEIWMRNTYDYKVDIFSLGCVVFEMAALQHPFYSRNTMDLQKKILMAKIPELPQHFSKEFSLILKLCMSRDLKQRPNSF